MRPTDEQQEIVDVAASGADLVIEAGAGTGKSSTLKMVAQNEKDRRGLCIYFNRAPAAEARRTFPPNVACSTAHSLAWHAMKERPFMERLDGPPVTAKSIAEDFLGIKSWFKTPKGYKDVSSWKVASLAVQTVRNYCYSDAREIGTWHVPTHEMHLPAETDAELRRKVLPFAREIWEDLQCPDGWAQFMPDHYMKIWALEDPVMDADFMMVDESQDTNGVLAGILRRQTHLQRILVGDSQQRLFSWRGTVDMMKEFDHAETRFLTQSFRFGQAVADEANLWLEYLDAPLRLRGLPSINSRLDFLEHPDAILCRTNADTIEQAMEAQDRGFEVAIVGGTDEIASFAYGVDDLKNTGKSRHRELTVFQSWADVVDYVTDEKPGGNFGTAVRLIQRYGTGMIKRIAANCVDERQADYCISTVHKVKGLEWPRVMLDRNIAPDDDEDQEEMSRGELMVAYVATTRAREVLDATSVRPFHDRRRRMAELARVEEQESAA
jgi:hypothetical protein